jgi:hypothetical protein
VNKVNNLVRLDTIILTNNNDMFCIINFTLNQLCIFSLALRQC